MDVVELAVTDGRSEHASSLPRPCPLARLADADRRGAGFGTVDRRPPDALETTEIAAAEVDGRIYVVGGYSGDRVVEIYDPAADRWTQGAAFPHSVHHAAAVGWNGKLYLFGGYVDGWKPNAATYEYDPPQDRWRPLPDLPTPRGSPSAAVINGMVHVVVGVAPGGKNTPVHEVYDVATGT
jgi:Kelch motif protein